MSRHVISAGMDDTLQAVRDLFESHNFHHVVVLDDGKLVGVVSDRDLLMNISPFVGGLAERPQDLRSMQRKVHQVMSRDPVWVTELTPIQDAARLMLQHDVSCLPVLDGRAGCRGIVTMRDILRWLVKTDACRLAA
ncbi:MAG: CBS domain-containing protein [Phycisphaerales bacterium]|nr:CBS domain-containing protein [Phycisphaerales bacterium]